jgi:hypothetical protein
MTTNSPIGTTNTPVLIAPGLTLTTDLYAAAEAGVAEHAPDLGPLHWDGFFSQQWTLIPDEITGEPYKAQLILTKSRSRTAILNLWLAPDLRGGDLSKPHNHPWDFHSATLSGLIVEDRVVRVAGELVHTSGVEHRVGDINRVGRETFHEVVDVDPGLTMTLMMCGPGMSDWGYLDGDGAFTKAVVPEGFMARLREINPHQR